jgi:hypothetical protein
VVPVDDDAGVPDVVGPADPLAVVGPRVFGPISGSSIVGQGIATVVRHGHVFLGKL